MRAVWEAGLSIAADVAIVGAANVHHSDLLRVPLSTVDQSSYLMGEKAAELLLESIESKTLIPPKQVFLPLRLVVRESSGRKVHAQDGDPQNEVG
jgi:LacI family transcriptional regulator